MAGPSQINSACNCCEVPPTGAPTLAFVSAVKSKRCSINTVQCGFGPEGYLVRTATNADGSTAVTTCTTTPTGCPPCTTVCSGTVVETSSGSNSFNTEDNGPVWVTTDVGSGSVLIETTTTYNQDCSTSSETTCSGQSTRTTTLTKAEGSPFPNQAEEIVEECNSTVIDNDGGFCIWSGTSTRTVDGVLQYEVGVSGPCVEIPLTTFTTEPERVEPSEEFSSPSDPFEVKNCEPETGTTSLPEFIDCTPEGEEPQTPNLEDGQGYNNGAYDFEDEETGSTSSQIFKYRVEHAPSATCYLKVWIKKTTETESGTTEDTAPPYEWRGSGYPCYADESKIYTACENIIYGQPSGTISASRGQSISVSILKYSFLEDYEPNDPDENGDQGCKPNGFPIADTSTCSDGEQQ